MYSFQSCSRSWPTNDEWLRRTLRSRECLPRRRLRPPLRGAHARTRTRPLASHPREGGRHQGGEMSPADAISADLRQTGLRTERGESEIGEERRGRATEERSTLGGGLLWRRPTRPRMIKKETWRKKPKRRRLT